MTELRAALRALFGGLVTVLVGSDKVPGMRRRRVWPTLVAAVVTVLLALAMVREVRTYFAPPPPLVPLLALLLVLPVLLLPRWPLMAWRLSLVTLLALMPFWRGAGEPWHPVQVVVYLAALAAVGLRHRPVVLGWVWAGTIVLTWVIVAPRNGDDAVGTTVVVTLLTLASGGLGAVIAARRRLAVAARRTEEEQARNALLSERARIARELHDVVAHHMSLIAVQAETAPYRLTGLPTDATDEFTSISGAAREALVEMRRLLGVLRSDPDQVETAPQPGLAALPDLLDRVRQAGTPVTLTTDGEPTPVPAGVDVSAYRIVQESLSNARRHAPGAEVTVLVGYDPGAVRVEVANGPADADPAPADGPGHGLVGMRERATMLGGTLTAGRTADGGFRVAAVLPHGTDEGDA
ncbi:MAG TPA: histidine kinase [Actinocatenispora sp.]